MATLDEYFANKEGSELGADLVKKVADFNTYLLRGRMRLYRRAYNMYYLSDQRKGELTRAGDQGQFRLSNTNHFKSILQAILSITTGQRPAWQPRATNTDYKSQAQTEVAAGVLDYFFYQNKLERFPANAAEYALLLGEAGVGLEWDATLGEDWRPEYTENEETQEAEPTGVQKTGDLKVTSYMAQDIIRDLSLTSWEACNWIILRSYVNRYEVAAKFPTYESEVMATQMGAYDKQFRLGHTIDEVSDDVIPLFVFYHKATTACPNGRIAVFLGDGKVLLSGELPYDRIPFYRIVHTEKANTTFGHTIAFDLLNRQIEYDKLASIILTNEAAFGVQSIIAPIGTSLSSTSIMGGMKMIEYPAGEQAPTSLNLLNTPGEVFRRLGEIEASMEKLAGIPGLLRGQVPPNINSGTGLAFLSSQALQFNSPFQRAWFNLLEDMGTGVIQILRRFAKAPRIMTIIGKADSYKRLEFTGEEISGIDRVQVEVTNPLSKTYAGRIQMAQDLMSQRMIKTTEEYFTVLATGNVKPLTDNQTTEILSIRKENEDLIEGKEVLVLLTDNAPLHIKEHLAVLDNPEVRRNPEIVKRVLQHVLKQQQAWHQATQNTPDLLSVRGIPPAPTAAPGAIPPGAPPAAPGTPAVVDRRSPEELSIAGINGPAAPRPPRNIPEQEENLFQEAVATGT